MEATVKLFSDKEKEINHLKNHNQILLKEVKQLKRKVKSILKVDKETSMDAIESRNSLKFEMKDRDTFIDSIE